VGRVKNQGAAAGKMGDELHDPTLAAAFNPHASPVESHHRVATDETSVDQGSPKMTGKFLLSYTKLLFCSHSRVGAPP